MKRIFLVVTILTLGQHLFAQTFQKISINTGFNGTQGKLIVADLDNDGDPDAVLSALGNSGLAIFKNNNGSFTRTNLAGLAFNDGVYSIDAGDVNRDGYVDILQSGRSLSGYTLPSPNLLLNNGATLTPAAGSLIAGAAQTGGVYFGDSEGDGDLDVISASRNGIILNRNNALTEYGPYFPKSGTWYAHWWNLDSDTELEVIQMWGQPGIGWVGGTVFLERNLPAMSVSNQFSYDAMLIQDPVIADFDGDGDFDMLNRKLDNWTNHVRIYRNDNGKFVDSGISFGWGETVEFADINNDGLYDVIVGGTMTGSWMVFETAIYINQNDGTFVHLNAGISSSERSQARVADFDGDGDLDLLTMDGAFQNNINVVNAAPVAPTPLTPIISGSTIKLRWLPGTDDKTPLNGLTYNISVRAEDGTIVVPSHALASGKRQIYKIGNAWNNLSFDLSCLKEGKYYWQVQTLDASYQGSAFSAEQSFTIEKDPPVAPANLTATTVADNGIELHWTDMSSTEDEFIIFRSGSPDLTMFNALDTVAADITSYLDTLYLEPETTYQYRVVASNCAYPDVFTSTTEPVKTFPRAFVNSEWLDPGSGSGRLALLGDVDRDEDLDLVISHTSKTTTKLYRFNGTAYEDSGIEFKWADFGQWIDYDDDGYIDLLLSTNSLTHLPGPVTLYRNEQGESFSEVTSGLFSGELNLQAGVSAGDYDNDGDDDLAIQTNAGIYLLDNNGKGSFSRNQAITLPSHMKSRNAWADYDNDGDLDLLANKEVSCTSNVIVIFENTNNNEFVAKEFNTLQGTNKDFLNYTGDMSWGDYDNDGYPDIIVAGENTCGNGSAINRIYHNNKDKTFTYVASLVQLTYDVTVEWGDYDNDGDLDVFAFGDPFGAFSERTRIYRNEGTRFRETNINYLLQSTQYGKAVRGDIDNDGDLDYVILGEVDYTQPKTIVYRNTYAESWGLANQKPTAPESTSSHVDYQSVTLSWTKGEDDETQQSGLTYNLYVVRQPDETNPQADSLTMNSYSTESGFRMIASPGNVNGTTITLKNLIPGTYHWAVQSVDKGFAGSAFSTEKSFVISAILGVDNELSTIVNMYPNPVSNQLTIVSKQPQHDVQLQLHNAWGQPITAIGLNQSTTTYDMSLLPAGLYVATVYRNGVRVGSEKVLKK